MSAYDLDPSKCQAAVSFHVAPWITVQCHRTPRHEGEHEASVVAPIQKSDRLGALECRPSTRVWLTWKQNLSPEAES